MSPDTVVALAMVLGSTGWIVVALLLVSLEKRD